MISEHNRRTEPSRCEIYVWVKVGNRAAVNIYTSNYHGNVLRWSLNYLPHSCNTITVADSPSLPTIL